MNKEVTSKNISEKSDQFGSYSEPNSARSLDYKPYKNKNVEKNKSINYAEGYSSDMGESKMEDGHFVGYNNSYNNNQNQQQFYANPPFGYNNPNTFSQQQFQPNNQFFNGNFFFTKFSFHPPLKTLGIEKPSFFDSFCEYLCANYE